MIPLGSSFKQTNKQTQVMETCVVVRQSSCCRARNFEVWFVNERARARFLVRAYTFHSCPFVHTQTHSQSERQTESNSERFTVTPSRVLLWE